MVTAVASPTLEPVRDALAALFLANLPAELASLADINVPLPMPTAAQIRLVNKYDPLVDSVFPTLVIESGVTKNITIERHDQQGIWYEYRGEIQVFLFARNDAYDVLARQIDRYTVALWNVLSEHDPLPGGYRIDPVGPELGHLALDASVNISAAAVALDYLWRAT